MARLSATDQDQRAFATVRLRVCPGTMPCANTAISGNRGIVDRSEQLEQQLGPRPRRVVIRILGHTVTSLCSVAISL